MNPGTDYANSTHVDHVPATNLLPENNLNSIGFEQNNIMIQIELC